MPVKLRTYSYRGHKIVTKRDHGANPPKNPGWVVCDNNAYCNVAPGATWFHTLKSARRAIDVLIAIEGEKNANLFWEVIQPNTWAVGQKENDYGAADEGSMSHGRFSAKIKGGVIVSITVKPLEVPARIVKALRKIGVTLPNIVAVIPA